MGSMVVIIWWAEVDLILRKALVMNKWGDIFGRLNDIIRKESSLTIRIVKIDIRLNTWYMYRLKRYVRLIQMHNSLLRLILWFVSKDRTILIPFHRHVWCSSRVDVTTLIIGQGIKERFRCLGYVIKLLFFFS